MEINNRPLGNYWVKYWGSFEVAWYNLNDIWWRHGVNEVLSEKDFQWIDTNKIPEPQINLNGDQ